MTKFAHRVVDVEEIPRLVSHAFRTATSGAPGPVLIDFPIEILFSPVQKSRISWGSLLSPLPYPAGPHPEAIAKTVALLRESKRPIIVTGTGGRFLNVIDPHSPRLLHLTISTLTDRVLEKRRPHGILENCTNSSLRDNQVLRSIANGSSAASWKWQLSDGFAQAGSAAAGPDHDDWLSDRLLHGQSWRTHLPKL